MKKPSFAVCPEGVVYIAMVALATLTFAILEWGVPAVVMLGVTLLTANFFRDPERVPPEDETLAVAPADGKVVRVERLPDPLTGKEKLCVCIFMNVFDVHVNRMPVSGTVTTVRYIPGAFVNASDKNERCVLGFNDERGAAWSMVQIAGLVARRIVCWAEAGDGIDRAQRYGLIKFGSRVDVYLPDGWRPLVNVGERTVAGQTAIAGRE